MQNVLNRYVENILSSSNLKLNNACFLQAQQVLYLILVYVCIICATSKVSLIIKYQCFLSKIKTMVIEDKLMVQSSKDLTIWPTVMSDFGKDRYMNLPKYS